VTLQVIFHELAERDLNDAAAYYFAQERPGLGEAFLAEVARVVRLLAELSLAGSPSNNDIRRWRLRRFPYAVIYRIRTITSACSRLRPSSAVLLTGTAGREPARSNKPLQLTTAAGRPSASLWRPQLDADTFRPT
jgi:plasmid stabilization system protein ParE